MLERDEKMLERAKLNGMRYVYFIPETGVIVGKTKHSRDPAPCHEGYDGKYEKMTIEEYEWLTDKTRVTKVVTAADLYDKVKWTNKGFVVDGKPLALS